MGVAGGDVAQRKSPLPAGASGKDGISAPTS